MSKDSTIFLNEIHLLIDETVSNTLDTINSDKLIKRESLGGNLTIEDFEIIKTLRPNEEQKKVIRKLFIAACRLTASGILGIIDGIVVSSKYEIPDLSLINRSTGEDIAKDVVLNEEFYRLLEE